MKSGTTWELQCSSFCFSLVINVKYVVCHYISLLLIFSHLVIKWLFKKKTVDYYLWVLLERHFYTAQKTSKSEILGVLGHWIATVDVSGIGLLL